MGGKKIVDLEAKLFDPEKRGCMTVLVGPRKVGEIDYEVRQDGGVRMKVGLRGARVPEGASRVTVFVNGESVLELDAPGGAGFVRLDSAHGDTVPGFELEDAVEIRANGSVIGEGKVRRD